MISAIALHKVLYQFMTMWRQRKAVKRYERCDRLAEVQECGRVMEHFIADIWLGVARSRAGVALPIGLQGPR